MKKHLLLSVIFLLPLSVFAQNCGGYYYLTKNAEIQMASYDKDGTAGVVVTSKVSQVGAIPDGIQWFAPGFGIVKTADYNRGGKEVGSTVLTAFKQ